MPSASISRVRALSVRVGVTVAVLVGAAFRPVTGQQTAALERQLDSLAARLRVATAVKLAYDDSAKEEIALLDSVDVGPARVLTPPALVPPVRWAMQRAMTEIERRYGSFPDLLAETHADRQVLVRRTVALGKPNPLGVEYEVHLLVRGNDQYSTSFGDSVALVGALEERFLRLIAAHVSQDSTGWFAGLVPPWQTETEEGWALRRVALASAPTAVARRCFQGDEPSCKAALGVVSTADPLLDLYDATDRRSAVLGLVEARRASRSSTNRCLAGDDAECVYLLRKTSWAMNPLGSDMRTGLVQEALTIGGTGAFGRLVRATGTPAEQLSATAGVSLDSLVASWQAHIHNAQLPSGNMTPTIAAVSLGWMVLFTGLALRSSRWR